AVRRVYPQGRLVAHVVGFTDIDGHGLAGMERTFEAELRQAAVGPLALAIDMRFQQVLREELARSMAEFQAVGAAGVVLDARSGEVLAMVSLPDFDPHRPPNEPEARFNRASLGVYEMGSVFKVFTTAIALDSGVVRLTDGYDATRPIRVQRYLIRDFHPKKRWLTVPEIFVYSSNIGAAKMALDVGTDRQRAFLGKLGLLQPSALELLEVASPIVPFPWREINTMTIGFGHGLAVSPVQLAAAFAAIVNGGIMRPPTLLARENRPPPAGRRVISPKTSAWMRQLLRLVVTHGTGRKAAAAGYLVGGKTGTGEKAGPGGYRRRALLSSFAAAFPIHAPRYVVLAMLDEPKGTPETFGYATGGWTAAPTAGRIIARLGPLAGIRPLDDDSDPVRPPLSPEGVGEELRFASF
ncbi:MAG: peptidoglycan D,D-transpeptidase FtsI family protein, partial [Alphaproteobacteria bacterium]